MKCPRESLNGFCYLEKGRRPVSLNIARRASQFLPHVGEYSLVMI